jgi:hypothetical protein
MFGRARFFDQRQWPCIGVVAESLRKVRTLKELPLRRATRGPGEYAQVCPSVDGPAYWIVEGHDGPGLVRLAGRAGNDPHDVCDVLAAAVSDAGVSIQASDEAAAPTAFSALAQLHACGRAGERWIGDKINTSIAEVLREPVESAWTAAVGVEDQALVHRPAGVIAAPTVWAPSR